MRRPHNNSRRRRFIALGGERRLFAFPPRQAGRVEFFINCNVRILVELIRRRKHCKDLCWEDSNIQHEALCF